MELDEQTLDALADELAEAGRTRTLIPRITARHPEATVEDSYAIQGRWRKREQARGRRLAGRKIGLTYEASVESGFGRTCFGRAGLVRHLEPLDRGLANPDADDGPDWRFRQRRHQSSKAVLHCVEKRLG